MQNFHMYAATASGIEALAGRELRDLGYETKVENGRVRFDGTIADAIRTNLWLRTADRIKIIVAEFDARTFDELFEKTKAYPWDQLLPMDARFPVEGRSQKSQLHSVPNVQAIVKKAIVNKLSDVYHRRTRLPETGQLYPLEVAINKDHVLLTLDTTGASLFKRGYRLDKGTAPLKENMAAALIDITTWHPKTMPFLDPTCGSGTLPIEAALIGRNIAPGFNRDFVCESWDWVDAQISKDLRAEADSLADYDAELEIYGSDIDGSMIDISRVNAQEAGVLHDIQFKQVAVADLKLELDDGVIISNPPYGERMSDRESVHKLYRQMGHVFRPMRTSSAYFLTADLEFEEYYGEKATKKRKLYNGALRTDYFQYWAKERSQKFTKGKDS
ncbi:THUMP domain-containing class I SAM-dependent RNA methyltransferase [Levilactobacillus bambusae]|uniref:RNA methyltransferase n=1 Tax=Levilactobacillus bambusae TaxID=2024736 RepID=A0A2V1N2Q1_9LACO|nr:class I SAM-dependent RNA methyltransferase [Levilactobacillus bambusae]PWG00868.1 RNA methyltransferase [Levilactobacillus bambusae]